MQRGNRIILRRGQVANDRDDTPLLINDRGEGYRVNDTAISLWNMCNGISFEDLLHEVMRISNESEDNLKRSLSEMIKQFNEISVVEIKKIKN